MLSVEFKKVAGNTAYCRKCYEERQSEYRRDHGRGHWREESDYTYTRSRLVRGQDALQIGIWVSNYASVYICLDHARLLGTWMTDRSQEIQDVNGNQEVHVQE